MRVSKGRSSRGAFGANDGVLLSFTESEAFDVADAWDEQFVGGLPSGHDGGGGAGDVTEVSGAGLCGESESEPDGVDDFLGLGGPALDDVL